MKVRTDFVSNSSSSSFIVLHKDNKYGMLLDRRSVSRDDASVQHLDLKGYFARFGWRELFESDYSKHIGDKDAVKFVTDQAFCRLFMTASVAWTLPKSAKKSYDAYCAMTTAVNAYEEKLFAANKDRSGSYFRIEKDKKLSDMRAEQDALEQQILAACVKVLKPSLGKEVFDYAEVEDHWNPDYDDLNEEFDSECDKLKMRLDYLKSLDTDIKFSRYFSNH